MGVMRITLVLVRHGEADHNVLQEQRSGSGVILNEVIDTDLTENGREQARRVALRLKEERFDLVVSSDLRRGRDTARAVARLHDNMEVNQWKSVRERFYGVFEMNSELGMKLMGAQVFVEECITDRSLLTWRIPGGGESVMDLRTRITEQFLPHLMSEARLTARDNPRLLVTSHGLFIKELHRILGEKSSTAENFSVEKPCVNTSVSQYQLEVDHEQVKDVVCDFYSCDKHLQ